MVTVALCGTAAGIAWAVTDFGPEFPSRWDRRVQRYVDFVEEVRGLEFDHPVHVYFLSTTEYSAASRGLADEGPVPPNGTEQKFTAIQRALGQIQGEPDLSEAGGDLIDSGTLAFYNYVDKVINVRGTEVNLELEVTLVHELTHALQDQRFDLETRFTTADSEESLALRTIVEGDAGYVEQTYVERLPEERRNEYRQAAEAAAGGAQTALASVPSALQAALALPYALGRPYVLLTLADGGGPPDPARLNARMAEPPAATVSTFTPGLNFDSNAKVDRPDIGGTQFLSGRLGAYGLYLMLAERISASQAMLAVDGWRGDELVAAEVTPDRSSKRRAMCVAVAFATADDAAATQLGDALGDWKSSMPVEASITIERRGDVVEFRTCDAGADAEMKLGDPVLNTVSLPAARMELTALVVGQYGMKVASCAANGAIELVTADELSAGPLSTVRQQDLRRAVDTAAQSC